MLEHGEKDFGCLSWAEGTFTEAAVSKHFGGAVEKNSSSSIEEVFKEVQSCRSLMGWCRLKIDRGMVNQT